MTEIIESDHTEDISADHWAGVARIYDPRPQQELDKLTAEFFAKGGVATWLPSGPDNKPRHHALYYASKAIEQREVKRSVKKRAEDAALVEAMSAWLDQNPLASRRKMNKDLHLNDTVSSRILDTYFVGDPRAEPFMCMGMEYKRNKNKEDDARRVAQIKAAVEIGVLGYDAVGKATCLTRGVVMRLVSKYNLDITHYHRSTSHDSLQT